MTAAPRRRSARAAAEGVCRTLCVDGSRVAAARASMPSDGVIAEVADLFSALADPTRLRLLLALGERELCVCDLARVAGRSMAATSHQLQLLRKTGLVAYRMAGKLAYYRATDGWTRSALDGALARVGRRRSP